MPSHRADRGRPRRAGSSKVTRFIWVGQTEPHSRLAFDASDANRASVTQHHIANHRETKPRAWQPRRTNVRGPIEGREHRVSLATSDARSVIANGHDR